MVAVEAVVVAEVEVLAAWVMAEVAEAVVEVLVAWVTAEGLLLG